MKFLALSVFLFLANLSATAIADTLVLVHGYLGSAQSWAEAGVVDRLERRGWRTAAVYGYGPVGIVRQPVAGGTTEQRMFLVNLPSQAPVVIQADWLAAYLRDIRERHPESPITLAAHSAGGLAARLALVRQNGLGVEHLITIATPHLGTGRAAQALEATNQGGVLGGLRSWLVRRTTGDGLYATLQQSRGVLLDLLPPAPGNFLGWLNQQAHPDIRYTSIMRSGTFVMPGDQVVPPVSQDMRRVPALAGRVRTYRMAQGHLLTPQDGDVIGNLLAGTDE